MATRVTEIDENTGRVRSGKRPKAATLIPLTPAPKTRWQRFKRSAVG